MELVELEYCLEVARQLQIQDPEIGVDIIFFDAEDMGTREGGQNSAGAWVRNTGLRNPHVPGYSARYGILLDMVGPKDAIFGMEGHSMVHASSVVKKVWRTGIGVRPWQSLL